MIERLQMITTVTIQNTTLLVIDCDNGGIKVRQLTVSCCGCWWSVYTVGSTPRPAAQGTCDSTVTPGISCHT